MALKTSVTEIILFTLCWLEDTVVFSMVPSDTQWLFDSKFVEKFGPLKPFLVQ